MDRLTLADQQKFGKMSGKRLRAKLVHAAHDKTDIELTERGELLDLFANLLVQTQTHVSVSEQETTIMEGNFPPAGWTGGHTDLDREAFEFEKMKWADEMRKWEAEERHKVADEKHRVFERRKWEAEQEDRMAEMKLKEAEFELKKNETAKQETSVGKSKVFSDAMRSSAIRMSDDPVEAVVFFVNVEQLFDVYKVPTDLKARLIRQGQG